jgi:hypothetical protein
MASKTPLQHEVDAFTREVECVVPEGCDSTVALSARVLYEIVSPDKAWSSFAQRRMQLALSRLRSDDLIERVGSHRATRYYRRSCVDQGHASCSDSGERDACWTPAVRGSER